LLTLFKEDLGWFQSVKKFTQKRSKDRFHFCFQGYNGSMLLGHYLREEIKDSELTCVWVFQFDSTSQVGSG